LQDGSLAPTRLFAFAAGGLANVPHVMYFHWKAYGNPLTPGHQMLETQKFAIEHQTGLWGVVWPTWDHVKALSIDPGFGFFSLSPFMWIGVVGAPFVLFFVKGPPGRRRAIRIATIVWVLAGALLFAVNAGIIEWRAGWTVGPRYLAACPPFFALGGAIALESFARHSRWKRAIAHGVGGGLALASVLSIGTVSLTFDTLPESIARPFTQFALPLARAGFVPHHIGEWVGWNARTFWYIACGAMLFAPILAGLARLPRESIKLYSAHIAVFVLAAALGVSPQFTKPDDGSELFALHPSVAGFSTIWEPKDRDRVSEIRIEAERRGTRGSGPCLWHRLADMERSLGLAAQASADEARAGNVPADRCPKRGLF
jgi:hypothetical protein